MKLLQCTSFVQTLNHSIQLYPDRGFARHYFEDRIKAYEAHDLRNNEAERLGRPFKTGKKQCLLKSNPSFSGWTATSLA
jgi:uncharacterized NAD(P)/FAD-binding protein YdhS